MEKTDHHHHPAGKSTFSLFLLFPRILTIRPFSLFPAFLRSANQTETPSPRIVGPGQAQAQGPLERLVHRHRKNLGEGRRRVGGEKPVGDLTAECDSSDEDS